MSLRRRVAAAVAAVALAALGGCGGGEDEPPRIVSRSATLHFEPHWVGRSFDGMALTSTGTDVPGVVSMSYGTCELPEGEGGCAVPVTIQTTSICDRNALLIDARPRPARRVRGVDLREYDERRAELATADTNVTIFASRTLRERVLPVLRAVDRRPAGDRLRRARYPRAYVDELRRVRDAYVRLGSVRAVRDRLGISQRAVRFRLALARELGSRRLRRPAAQFKFNGRCAIEP